MPKRLAPLLPAELNGDRLPFDSPREDPSKRKRVGTDVACNPCRRRKTRCDGIRPTCAACRKRSTECIFIEKKESPRSGQSPEGSHEILELLKSAPEPQAFEILRLLRTNGDPNSVLNIIKGGMNGMTRPSDHDASCAIRSTQSPLEFELMVKNPVAYPALRHVPLTTLERDRLLGPSKLRRSKSFDYQYLLPLPAPGEHADLSNGSRSAEWNIQHQNLLTDNDTTMKQTNSMPLYDDNDDDDDDEDMFRLDGPSDGTFDGSRQSVPFLCDERLKDLSISYWTDVSMTDDYAARVISLYLTTDHPLLGVFDPHLFISDLVGRRHTYCSRLLVNALMYWSCQMYTAIDERAVHHAETFCKEAEKLWLLEKNNTTILNAASAQLLSLAYLGHGKAHYVLKYLAAALRMGTSMFLFGVESSQALKEIEGIPPETQRANSYTAWGIFNWGVLTTLFYQQPGLEYPVYPPVYPVPTEPVDRTTRKESDNSSSDALEDLPSYMGHTFPTLCKFWGIIHGVTLAYYKNRQSPLPDHVSLDFAEYKYRELLAWMERLPSDQMLRDDCPHHVIIFHIWFHAAILDIFRPFIRSPRHQRHRLKTFSARRASPDAAFNASVSQLKQLVVRYRCNYESSTYTLLWQSALIYVANAVLHETQDPEWRFYFLTCIYGYEGLRKSYRIAEVITRGLLTMTLRDGDISGKEARHLLKQIREAEKSHAKEDVRATFMVDLDLAMTDPDAARVENLAERFEDIALFREFTTVDDDEMESFRHMKSNDAGNGSESGS
ncbi:N-terminal fungal transcription regulatory domain-containing protein (zinc finger protein) [Colletotrichum tofieldiae]|uniref:N-terminal fungal transcription regulatory domain-containing protein (Zinc finger protein) n=1 Tax=Colletotrichum tofieldiae TaxID=708197 RepID=A0A166YTC9_9PEZI|nr:N-terminal fungal transcription regulatory domain-containing protein (zinc finger protein) [Colletotrichum tofieldiae]